MGASGTFYFCSVVMYSGSKHMNISAYNKNIVILDHMKSVECVAFSSDSRLLCSGSWDKSAVLWNTEVITDSNSQQIKNFLALQLYIH